MKICIVSALATIPAILCLILQSDKYLGAHFQPAAFKRLNATGRIF